MDDNRNIYFAVPANNSSQKTVTWGISLALLYGQVVVMKLFNKLDPNTEGTEIGLALVKRNIEVHGGNIWAESKGTGKGSTFSFMLVNQPNTKVHNEK